jgi:hypothetical protein
MAENGSENKLRSAAMKVSKKKTLGFSQYEPVRNLKNAGIF